MKIAIVMMMHSEPSLGGELSNMLNLQRSLAFTAPNIIPDCYVFTDTCPSGVWKNVINIQSRQEFVPRLNSYDFIIFTAPGSRTDREEGPWWHEPLSHIRRPFAVQIQSEDNARIFVDRNEFFYHPFCRAGIEIETGFFHVISPDVTHLPIFRIGPWDYAWLYRTPREPVVEKLPLVISTAMLANRKRVTALVKCAKDLAAIGLQLHIWGVSYAWSCLSTIKKIHPEHWLYKGAYEYGQDVESGAMFHYNGTSKGLNRIELTTFQAVMRGCCPILNRDFAPSWVTPEMAILVTLQDVETFADQDAFIADIQRVNPTGMNHQFFVHFRIRNSLSELIDFVLHMENSK